MISRKLFIGVLLWPLLFSGCAQYVITQELEQPISKGSACSIGAIVDELPSDMDEADKPTMEAIDKLRDHLLTEINKEGLLNVRHESMGSPVYELSGSILEYKKGSGFVRFMIGFGAGDANITISLKLTNVQTGQIIFGGNFKGVVSSWAESGDKMFKNVSKNFAKALKKAMKNSASTVTAG